MGTTLSGDAEKVSVSADQQKGLVSEGARPPLDQPAPRKGPDWHSDPQVVMGGDVSWFRASFTDVASLPKPASEAPLSSLYPHDVNTVLIHETGDRYQDRKAVAGVLGVKVRDINPHGYQWHHAPTTGVMQLVSEEGHKAAHRADRKGSAAVTSAYGKRST